MPINRGEFVKSLTWMTEGSPSETNVTYIGFIRRGGTRGDMGAWWVETVKFHNYSNQKHDLLYPKDQTCNITSNLN